MRENYRKSIASIEKLPQFTTMNVIDGQAGIIICSRLIFYSLTIDNILNIIVLLILAGVSIAMLTGENGMLTKAQDAKEETRIGAIEEAKILWNNENEFVKYTEDATEKTLGELLLELRQQNLLSANEMSDIIDDGKITIGDKTIEFKKTEPGLYDSKTKKLIKTWEQMIKDGDVRQNDGLLEYVNYELVGEIVISNIVTEIGSYAFDVNNTITDVVIPDSVKIIRYDAFCACRALKEIRIPSSVELIEPYAIDVSDNLRRIVVAENNKNYSSSDDGVLFNKSKTELIKVPESYPNGVYHIENNVNVIKEYSFERCKNIQEVIVPESVTVIEDRSFNNFKATIRIQKPENSIPGAPWGVREPENIIWEN